MLFSKKLILQIFYKIKDHLNSDTIISENILDLFMNSFYSENRIFYKNMDNTKIMISDYLNKLLEISSEDEFIDGLINYLHLFSFKTLIIKYYKVNISRLDFLSIF